MNQKLAIGLISLTACTGIGLLRPVAKVVNPSDPPREERLRESGGQGHPSEDLVSDPISLGSSSMTENPAQAATREPQGKAVETMTPLEAWANRTASRAAGKNGEVASQSARHDADIPPTAIRLSNDFRLPAAILAAAARRAEPSPNAIPAPIAAMSETLIANFYQSLATEVSRYDESSVEIDPVTGESTRVIEPNAMTDGIRKQSDELYRSLYGNEAYNQFLRQSAIERTLPTTDPSFSGE